MGHNRGPARRVADQPSARQRPNAVAFTYARMHVHADNRFMYLCTAAARLKGAWLHGVRGERREGKGKEAVCSADRDRWGVVGGRGEAGARGGMGGGG